jgi:hypothetical protein
VAKWCVSLEMTSVKPFGKNLTVGIKLHFSLTKGAKIQKFEKKKKKKKKLRKFFSFSKLTQGFIIYLP